MGSEPRKIGLMTAKTQFSAHRVCVAPLMDWNDNSRTCAPQFHQMHHRLKLPYRTASRKELWDRPHNLGSSPSGIYRLWLFVLPTKNFGRAMPLSKKVSNPCLNSFVSEPNVNGKSCGLSSRNLE
jgi:hypothetical protein